MQGENEKSRADSILAIMSASVHDMKAPLMCISGFADAILDGTVLPEKRDHYISLIRDEAKRLSLMCDEMLFASKIESGREIYEKAPFDICETARRVIISLEGRINDKNLDVDFDAEDGVRALGDENAFTRVIYNMMDNAIKFSPEGGKIELCLKNSCGRIRFSVLNEGESSADMDRVFEPFYSMDKKNGTGLGLYIASSIIKAHSGEIFASSGGGRTEFGFEIPFFA